MPSSLTARKLSSVRTPAFVLTPTGLLLCTLWFALLSSTALATDPFNPAYLADLTRRATEAKLSEERFWRLLLHYRANAWGEYTSEVDAPGFFLAPNGKTDPQAELEATLAQFFSEELVGRSRQPAQCAFIARYRWLKEKLAFDGHRLPSVVCQRFHSWFAELNPQSVTLIFASAFMNNPASMFGHTFLRVDQKGQTKQTRILAYTIHYAADVPPNVGVEYAIKGIFGGYKGYFSTIPYYIKVQEYRDIENRDIWEYKLNLNDEQIRWMLMHAWEMGNAYFDYFFFKENCAYHILSLLEVANPEWHLTDQFVFATIPADTVRLLAQEPDLIEAIAYRPSRRTQIKRQRERLTAVEDTWLRQIVGDVSLLHSDDFGLLQPTRQAFVLDIASDYLRFRGVSDPANANAYQEHNRIVLTSRSKIQVRSEDVNITPFAERPEIGHKIFRIGLGLGWREDEIFEEVTARATYHDILDPEIGYTPDTQLELLALRVRHYERRDQTRLEGFTLANVVSISPMDALFRSPSWKISAGLETVRGATCGLCSNWNVNGGIGAAFETGWFRREVFFAFAEADANYSKAYDEDHRVGGGATVGLLADLTERLKILASGSYLGFPLGDRSDDLRAAFALRVTLGQNLALRFQLNHRDHDDQGVAAVQAFF